MNKITTTILSLGLLQGASIAYAGFSPDDFLGHYGGTFYGSVFSVSNLTEDPADNVVVADIGRVTFEHIGDADGIDAYSGLLVANWLEIGLPPEEGREEEFECEYTIDPEYGRVNLDCALIDEATQSFDGALQLQCVLLPPHYSVGDILHPIKDVKGDLDCVGTLSVARDINIPAQGDILIANIKGQINNRN